MKINEIISRVNVLLAGETLNYSELKGFLDYTIDDINTALDAQYPTFSELLSGTVEYTALADKWIRQVIIPGVAWRFYVADEEGSLTAEQYERAYVMGLFYITRDMVQNVPLEYQSTTGSVSTLTTTDNSAGVTVDVDFFRL